MTEPKRRRGRPSMNLGGTVRAELYPADYDYVRAEIDRTDRPMARLIRELVAEAIAARKAQS